MGWSSAGNIFDKVADEAIIQVQSGHCSTAAATSILGKLIRELLDGDWDTEYESYSAYREHDFIVAAFKQEQPDIDKYDDDWEDEDEFGFV